MASNSLFDKYFRKSACPVQDMQPQQANVMQSIMDGFSQIRNNRASMQDLLLQNGRINSQQYNDLKAMGKDYRSMAQYLIQSGLIPQNIQGNPFISQIFNMLHR